MASSGILLNAHVYSWTARLPNVYSKNSPRKRYMRRRHTHTHTHTSLSLSHTHTHTHTHSVSLSLSISISIYLSFLSLFLSLSLADIRGRCASSVSCYHSITWETTGMARSTNSQKKCSATTNRPCHSATLSKNIHTHFSNVSMPRFGPRHWKSFGS